MKVKVFATEIQAKDLQPGDLFSTAHPEYWSHAMDDRGIGEMVYIRTNMSSDAADDSDMMVFKITIVLGEE